MNSISPTDMASEIDRQRKRLSVFGAEIKKLRLALNRIAEPTDEDIATTTPDDIAKEALISDVEL